ncbi:hypothetical protein HUB98_02960 [Paenibacillus barcinonensis]|uniref:Uncharacterized protein n=1 Tax=Paenibacillus barcinonensis TaxID=198119 RepID=A0A2V4WN11_PAEBA|nr:hypothetical protein [Paenibacillus barcinonensis]PYE49132.1 hypothetical protein DFQ00_106112 [Paenibacillus barcinonensis]QKS55371.1 hypothetical protein HUB98_02960 [Paenibacillus barcinonensis]
MIKKRMVLAVIAGLLLILLVALENAEAVVNSSQVSASYGGEQGTYKATVSFEMARAKKARNVKVLVIYPNHTVEYHDLSSSDGNYTLDVTKNVEDIALEKSQWSSPEFLITWESGDRKRVKYVYSGVR